ncbi:MAG: DNA polymerase I [bacterium]
MKKFIIIDGNAIIHRAYHALPPLTTKDGRIINAVYGFTSMILKVWKQLAPEYMVVTFDMAGPTFRHKKFEKYKATRVKADQELYDQIPLAHEVVRAFNIPIYEKKGYEADDVIGTIVKQVQKEPNIETYIVTGDMDALQLVKENVKVYTLRKGMSDIVIYDPKKVFERFGFNPNQIVDYKALRGDSSDNIPGINGIGEKTATDLIKQFGSLKKIYQAIGKRIATDVKARSVNADDATKSEVEKNIKPRLLNKLIEGEKDAMLSQELAQIDCNVPEIEFNLPDCELKNFNKEDVLDLFSRFEFSSLLKRVPGMGDTAVKGQMSKSSSQLKTKISFEEIVDSRQAKNLIKEIKENGWYACREIVDNQSNGTDGLAGLVFAVGDKSYWAEIGLLPLFDEIFNDSSVELIGHDLKLLIRYLLKNKVKLANKLFDLKIASYLLNPGSRAHDASSIALKVLGKEITFGAGQQGLFGIDYKSVAIELNELARSSVKLKNDLKIANNLGLMQKIEMPLIIILAQMEINGIAVDLAFLKKLSNQVNDEIKLLSRSIHNLAGEEFNISSTVQLREILFDKLELPTEGIRKGKTGYSTDSEQLGKLQGVHPVIKEIESYRELVKLQNTYIDVIPTLVDKKTNRIYTSFNQAVTATGRLSSSEPNLQNIPIRTEIGRQIRKAFIAESGNLLVTADYSQVELRIVASLAKDKRMMEIFDNNEDIHTATAVVINNVSISDVTKDMRRAAKEVNFGVLYGMGSYGLSWRASIPVWQAKDFIKKYFEQFKGVKKYIDQTMDMARTQGYCETLFGRRRYITEINSTNFQLRSAAERMAVNHPIQGTAADLMKMAMIDVSNVIAKQFPKDVKLILQVHDELVLEVKKGLEKKVGEAVKKTMEQVVQLNVPVKVDVHYGKTWGDME